MPSALTVVFVAISIFGAYAWCRAAYSSKGSHDHLAKLFSRVVGHAPKRKLAILSAALGLSNSRPRLRR
jgi:hypothetical protein